MEKVTRKKTINSLLIISSLFFMTCTNPVDFSAYSGKNLIPNFQFNTVNWTAESANFTNYELVSDNLGANAITDSWANYTSDPLLRVGAPTLSGGTNPNIYRLEVKNLVTDGDFEAGSFLTGLNPQAATVAATTFGYGNILDLSLSATETSSFDASSLLGTLEPLAISFRFKASNPLPHWFGYDAQFDYTVRTSAGAVMSPFQISDASSGVRFPFTTGADKANILSNGSGKKYFRINPSPPAYGSTELSPQVDMSADFMDDLELVSLNRDSGIRLNVPISETGRPDLLAGGTYTLKLWVRNDKTPKTANIPAWPAGTVNNRFLADFVSVSIHDDQTLTTTHGISDVVTYSRGLTTDSSWKAQTVNAWANWTQLSFSFTNLMKGPGTYAGLQIVISATNMGSALRSAGSILITKPELFWEP